MIPRSPMAAPTSNSISRFGGKADHLAQEIGIGAFPTNVRRFIMSSVIDRFSKQVGCRNPTLPVNINDRRYAARERLRHLRHSAGHDRAILDTKTDQPRVGTLGGGEPALETPKSVR